MTVRFTKTFPNYEAATRWCYEHGYTPACRFIDIHSECTITLEGDDAVRANEEQAKVKVVDLEAA